MEYAPLTQQQIDFLTKLKIEPIEKTIPEIRAENVNLDFLMNAGYLLMEGVYMDQDINKSRYLWKYTGKALS